MFAWAFSPDNNYRGYVRPDPAHHRRPLPTTAISRSPRCPSTTASVETVGFLFSTAGAPEVAYIPDVKSLPPDTAARLAGVPVLIIDALRPGATPDPHVDRRSPRPRRPTRRRHRLAHPSRPRKRPRPARSPACPTTSAPAHDGLRLSLSTPLMTSPPHPRSSPPCCHRLLARRPATAGKRRRALQADIDESAELARYYADAAGIPIENLVGLPLPKARRSPASSTTTEIRDPLRREFNRRDWWKLGSDPRRQRAAGPATGSACSSCMRGVPLKIKRGKDPAVPKPDPAKEPAKPTPQEMMRAGQRGRRRFRTLPARRRRPARSPAPITNHYHRSEQAIADAKLPYMMLVGRIDAADDETCRRMIDDAIAAEETGLWGRAYIDIANKIRQGDDWLESRRQILPARRGIPTVVDRFNDTLPTNYPMTDAALYFGWYAEHVNGPFLDPEFRFRRGAVAMHLHSFSAPHLRDPPRNWCAPLLARGAAATLGNVYEPFLGMTHDLDIFVDRLLDGHTLVEAAYMADPAASRGRTSSSATRSTGPSSTSTAAGRNSEADREYRALRVATMRWGDEPDELPRQTTPQGRRQTMHSGTLYEALGLHGARRRQDASAARISSTRPAAPSPTRADRIRQDFHLVAIDRAAGRKEAAIARLRDAEDSATDGLPEAAAVTAWLNILDPPPPPPARPGKTRRANCPTPSHPVKQAGPAASTIPRLPAPAALHDLPRARSDLAWHATRAPPPRHRRLRRCPANSNSRRCGSTASSATLHHRRRQRRPHRPVRRVEPRRRARLPPLRGRDRRRTPHRPDRTRPPPVRLGSPRPRHQPGLPRSRPPRRLSRPRPPSPSPATATTARSRASPCPPTALAAALELPRREVAIARAGPLRHPAGRASGTERLLDLLTEAARHRADRKAARFLRTADAQGRDAALFQAVAETLGYRANRLPMRLLAQRVPLATPARLDAPPNRAALLGAAGFLDPDLVERAPADTREHLQLPLAGLVETPRPLRQPTRNAHCRGRSTASAPPTTRTAGSPPSPCSPPTGPASAATPSPGRSRPTGRPPLPRRARTPVLDPPPHPRLEDASTRPIALVGRDRALELLANHLVPLALHEDPAFSWDDYLALPAPARNDKVKRAALRLFGDRDDLAELLRPLAHHQALLQIYHDFCLDDSSDCPDCPFPEQLHHW